MTTNGQCWEAVLHVLALAPDQYRDALASATAAAGTDDATHWRSLGRANAIQEMATAIAERAGLPAPDWDRPAAGASGGATTGHTCAYCQSGRVIHCAADVR